MYGSTDYKTGVCTNLYRKKGTLAHKYNYSGYISCQEAFIEPWNESVHEVLFFDTEISGTEFNGVAEDYDTQTKAEGGVHKIVPEAALRSWSNEIEKSFWEGEGERERSWQKSLKQPTNW